MFINGKFAFEFEEFSFNLVTPKKVYSQQLIWLYSYLN